MLPTALEAGLALGRRRAPRVLRSVSTTAYLRSEGGSSSSGSSSSAPSSSSSSTPDAEPPAPSYPSPFDTPDPAAHAETLRARRLDQLWDRVVRTPAAVVGVQDRPTRSILEPRTDYPRKLRGTTNRAHRAAGQTPHEASRFNAILSGILDKLHATEASTSDWAAGFNLGRGDDRGGFKQQPQQSQGLPFEAPQFRRRDDDTSPELLAAVDEAVEELSLVATPAEAVAWAEANLFVAARDEAGRTTYPAIYPRMFARVLAALRTRLNAPHVALALFEHARALGLESYLAGCNTAAYNELLSIRWGAFRDLQGVYAGVREMEVNAVFWDKKTAAIVGGVVDEVGREILGRRGSAHRWGDEAYVALAQLEQRIAEDTVRQERIFDTKAQVKRRGAERTGGGGERRGGGGAGEWRGSSGGGAGRQRSREDEASDWA